MRNIMLLTLVVNIVNTFCFTALFYYHSIFCMFKLKLCKYVIILQTASAYGPGGVGVGAGGMGPGGAGGPHGFGANKLPGRSSAGGPGFGPRSGNGDGHLPKKLLYSKINIAIN